VSTKYKGTPEEILALDTFIKFVRAYETFGARIEAQDTVGDLSGSQFGTLEMIYHLGPLTQKEIGQKLLVSKSNMVAVIDKLENRGFVKRQRSLEDRRCIFIHLTGEGRQKTEQVLPVHVAAITREMNYLAPEEQRQLGRLCRKLGLGK
jgi:MarR family 2-MHQ and catechol resistance regulon transcriptional repressor